MERIDESNGCLYVVPGTHKGQLYNHTYPDVIIYLHLERSSFVHLFNLGL
jgi:ectoine hydroxylase-related dioxygenase (phytanoyl-CoA dioxygenase family)